MQRRLRPAGAAPRPTRAGPPSPVIPGPCRTPSRSRTSACRWCRRRRRSTPSSGRTARSRCGGPPRPAGPTPTARPTTPSASACERVGNDGEFVTVGETDAYGHERRRRRPRDTPSRAATPTASVSLRAGRVRRDRRVDAGDRRWSTSRRRRRRPSPVTAPSSPGRAAAVPAVAAPRGGGVVVAPPATTAFDAGFDEELPYDDEPRARRPRRRASRGRRHLRGRWSDRRRRARAVGGRPLPRRVGRPPPPPLPPGLAAHHLTPRTRPCSAPPEPRSSRPRALLAPRRRAAAPGSQSQGEVRDDIQQDLLLARPGRATRRSPRTRPARSPTASPAACSSPATSRADERERGHPRRRRRRPTRSCEAKVEAALRRAADSPRCDRPGRPGGGPPRRRPRRYRRRRARRRAARRRRRSERRRRGRGAGRRRARGRRAAVHPGVLADEEPLSGPLPRRRTAVDDVASTSTSTTEGPLPDCTGAGRRGRGGGRGLRGRRVSSRCSPTAPTSIRRRRRARRRPSSTSSASTSSSLPSRPARPPAGLRERLQAAFASC